MVSGNGQGSVKGGKLLICMSASGEYSPPYRLKIISKISLKSTVKLARNKDFHEKYSPVSMCLSATRDQALTLEPPCAWAPIC